VASLVLVGLWVIACCSCCLLIFCLLEVMCYAALMLDRLGCVLDVGWLVVIVCLFIDVVILNLL